MQSTPANLGSMHLVFCLTLLLGGSLPDEALMHQHLLCFDQGLRSFGHSDGQGGDLASWIALWKGGCPGKELVMGGMPPSCLANPKSKSTSNHQRLFHEALPDDARCGVALGYPDPSSKLSDMATERRKLPEFCRILAGFVARQGPTAGGVGFGSLQGGESHAYHFLSHVSCLALEVH